MSSHKQRTIVVSLLAAVIGVRAAASEPLWDTAARFSARPQQALATALDGWSAEGSLGVASAQGVRELPLVASYVGAELAGLAPLVVQASWRALVLVLAVIGAIRLARGVARRLDKKEGTSTADTWTPWVAAIFFGCSALMVATVARHPLDGLAAATLPWVVHPLLTGRTGWRPAAVSAVWIGVAGFGSLAWAVAAVVAGGLATATKHSANLAQSLRWLALAGLASAWWVVLAVWESSYGTNVSELFPDRPLTSHLATAVGWMNLATPVAVVVATAPLAVAVAALLFRTQGDDQVLVGALFGTCLVGVTVLGLDVWRPPMHAGAGIPDRGVVLGPPLAMAALASLVAWTPLAHSLSERLKSGTWGWTYLRPSGLLLLLATAAIALPNAANLVAAAQERREIPPPGSEAVWAEIAEWSREAPPGRVLVLPAVDGLSGHRLVSQALSDRAWLGRDSMPTSGTPATRALDDLISRLVRGQNGPAVKSALRRLAVSYVLLRDDLPLEASRPEHVALTRAALRDAGARRLFHHVAPHTGSDSNEVLTDFGVLPSQPQVELWSLEDPGPASLHAGAPLPVLGEAAAIGDLEDAGMVHERVTRLVTDLDPARAAVLSDSARRRDIDLRVAVDPVGPALTAEDHPLVVPRDAAPTFTSFRTMDGAARVTASSSAADLGSKNREPGSHVMAALDGNEFTAWESRRGAGFGEWWQIDFDRPTNLSGGTVSFKQDIFGGHTVTGVRISTDQVTADREVAPGEPLSLDLLGSASRLRLTVTRVSTWTRRTDSVGITEVEIPGLSVRDELVVSGAGGAPDWLLATLPGSARHCVPPAGLPDSASLQATVCDQGLSVTGFESGALNRVLQNDNPRTVTGQVWARAAQTETAGSLADSLAEANISAAGSSVIAPDLTTRAQSAVDADPLTAWRPSPEDTSPTLTLSWADRTEVSGMRLELGDPRFSSRPTVVRVSGDAGEPVTIPVNSVGIIDLPPTRTRSLTIEFPQDTGLVTIDSSTSFERHVPIAVHEVELFGGPESSYDKDREQDLPCGSGPAVRVSGVPLKTRLSLTARDLLEGVVVRARVCSPIRLPVADVPVQVPASFIWSPLGLVLVDDEGDLLARGSAGPDRRELPLSAETLTRPSGSKSIPLQGVAHAGRSTLVLAVPSNAGWSARGADGTLSPVTVDGWAQGWSVPAGTEAVELAYSPGRSLRVGVAVGVLGWLFVLLALVSVPTSARGRSASDDL
ncbi:MAG TPA: alpha-(1-_3)-arabinofuranosyltransferase family protein [Nocardioidaceae bacterium]|nr:alpha-(1->3)-arabinofuranosyltransferase family protein [Nocardioidaceae bacterium]